MVVYCQDIFETDPNLNLLNVNITNGCYRYVILKKCRPSLNPLFWDPSCFMKFTGYRETKFQKVNFISQHTQITATTFPQSVRNLAKQVH